LVKKPRAWLDHEKFGICRSASHFRHAGVEAATQPGHNGSSISARAKLLESAPGRCRPFFSAYAIASSILAMVQFEPPKIPRMRPRLTSASMASTNSPTGTSGLSRCMK
jgi:hypothetical protein